MGQKNRAFGRIKWISGFKRKNKQFLFFTYFVTGNSTLINLCLRRSVGAPTTASAKMFLFPFGPRIGRIEWINRIDV